MFTCRKLGCHCGSEHIGKSTPTSIAHIVYHHIADSTVPTAHSSLIGLQSYKVFVVPR